MLVSFSVSGLFSYKDKQTLDLKAPKGTKIKNTHYNNNFVPLKKSSIMKSLLIFGANASGKTNLILSLQAYKDIIYSGFSPNKESTPSYSIQASQNQTVSNTTFSITLIGNDGQIYTHCLTFHENYLIKETFNKNNLCIFEFQDNKFTSIEESNRELVQRAKSLEELTHSEPLLRKMRDWELDEIKQFLIGLNNIKIIIDYPINESAKAISKLINSQEKNTFNTYKSKVVEILQLLDRTITDIEFSLEHSEPEILYEVLAVRNGISSSPRLESAGIKKMLSIILKFISMLTDGKTLIIDELDSSISTVAMINLFNYIIHTEENIKGQLIVTTHNPILFDTRIFHPSQIYLIEKRKDLSSEVYSLNDFDIRSGRKNLYLDYLKGNFGGVNV